MSKEKLIKKQPFKGKWAIITGGSKGIGKAVAKIFVQLGGNVCIVARTLETLNAAAEEIKSLKVGENQLVKVISCEMSNMEQVERLFKEQIKEYGVPDYVFNIVGISYPNYTEKLTVEDFKFHMNTNFFGQLNSILTILPYYMERMNIVSLTRRASNIYYRPTYFHRTRKSFSPS